MPIMWNDQREGWKPNLDDLAVFIALVFVVGAAYLMFWK